MSKNEDSAMDMWQNRFAIGIIRTIFDDNQVNIRRRKEQKEVLKSLVSNLSKNEIRAMEAKGRKTM